MKTLAIFGSTGSIGQSSLKVYNKNKSKFNLLYLSAHTNYKKLISQYKKYNPKSIIITDKLTYNKYKKKNILNEEIFFKKCKKKIDYVISGVSGFEALEINIKLLKICKNLLIANKETIICGGNVFLKLAKKHKCKIIPIDSEHYCLYYFLNSFKNKKLIDKIYLPASGGPFLYKKAKFNEKLNSVLKHPTWKMGEKISVDSSNLVNKILELFEAKILFNLNSNQLKIIIEEKSNIHLIIKLKNNFYIPIAHKPNMQLTISNSLNLKNNFELKLKNLMIHFKNPNPKQFPLIKLGKKLLRQDSSFSMIYFTVLNERLVNMFLNNKILYGDISNNLVKVFKKKIIKKKSTIKINNILDVFKAIKFAKNIEI